MLVVRATLIVNQASDSLTLTDTTGVYSSSSNPNGYGTINRAAANNIVTELVPTSPDGTVLSTVVLDGTTTPSADWIPKNALSRFLSITQLGLTGTEFPTGLIKLTYRPWFTTASAGTVNAVNGSVTIAANSAQDFTVDFVDSYKVRIGGVNYTIAPGGIATSTLTLTVPYAGITAAGLTAYIGYEANIAAIIDREFKVCFMPRFISNKPEACDKTIYSTLSKLFYQWNQVDALFAAGSFDDANTLLQDITRDCGCLASTNTTGGCSTCL